MKLKCMLSVTPYYTGEMNVEMYITSDLQSVLWSTLQLCVDRYLHTYHLYKSIYTNQYLCLYMRC